MDGLKLTIRDRIVMTGGDLDITSDAAKDPEVIPHGQRAEFKRLFGAARIAHRKLEDFTEGWPTHEEPEGSTVTREPGTLAP